MHVTFVCDQNSVTLQLSGDLVETGYTVNDLDLTSDPATITSLTRAIVHRPNNTNPTHS